MSERPRRYVSLAVSSIAPWCMMLALSVTAASKAQDVMAPAAVRSLQAVPKSKAWDEDRSSLTGPLALAGGGFGVGVVSGVAAIMSARAMQLIDRRSQPAAVPRGSHLDINGDGILDPADRTVFQRVFHATVLVSAAGFSACALGIEWLRYALRELDSPDVPASSRPASFGAWLRRLELRPEAQTGRVAVLLLGRF